MSVLSRYQNHVLGPHELVEWSKMTMTAYPVYAIQVEPFIGFKLECQDTQACTMDPRQRLEQIDRIINQTGFLNGSGCIIRESDHSRFDGLWVITVPVPRTQVPTQLNRLSGVMNALSRLGIKSTGIYEVNVSGKCSYGDTERCLSNLTIPNKFAMSLLSPGNSPYRYGYTQRINDNFMIMRTRWNYNQQNFGTISDNMSILAQLISTIFRN